ncbi:MAG: PAS domain S-box protein [Spirochaetota bacterium]
MQDKPFDTHVTSQGSTEGHTAQQFPVSRAELEKNYQLQQLIFEISAEFLSLATETIDVGIQLSLERIARFVGADRAYVFAYDFDRNVYNNTYEWCEDGVTPQIDILQDGPLSEIPEWVNTHCNGEPLYVQDVQTLPAGAVRETLEPQGIQSLLTVPLFASGTCTGFVGFDSVRHKKAYTEEERYLLSGYGNILQHVLKRKAIETELDLVQERQSILLNTISTQIWFLTDAQTYGEVNQAHASFFGATRDQLSNASLFSVLSDEEANVCQEGNARVFATAKAVHTYEWTTNFKGQKRLLEIRKHPKIDQHGEVAYVVCSAEDITEQRQMENSLKESSQRYNALFEQSPEGVFLHDLSGGILTANRAACSLTGYSRKELQTLTIFDLHGEGEKEREQILSQWYKLGDQDSLCAETLMRRKNGELVPVEVAINKIQYGEHVYIQMLGKDITERRQVEKKQQLLQQQVQRIQKLESLGRLAGGIAHEFNNQLGAILGLSELMLEEYSDNQHIRGHMESIMEAVRNAADLTKQLLAFARKQNHTRELIDLNNTVERLFFNVVKVQFRGSKTLSWTPAGDRLPIMMDADQLQHVLIGLCQNAWEAVPDGGVVSISTRKLFIAEEDALTEHGATPGEFACLEIADNGVGIEQERLNLVFEPFYTTKEIGDGTGLGLPLVYGIVSQNEGFIDIESTPGEGTRVSMYFPLSTGSE